jgi:hypothetical protein
MAMEMRYRVEFYDGSISDEEVVNSFEVTTAPYAFSVGDFVDPFGWGGKKIRCLLMSIIKSLLSSTS